MLTKEQLAGLSEFARQIRIHTLRQLAKRGFGHLGGSMSIVELLALLYTLDMKIDPNHPQWEERDWLVCSKGHAGPAIYAALALNGYFPVEWLDTLNQPGTNLPSHCDRLKTPGIDMTTGSLGQGLSLAVGVAIGFRQEGKANFVNCIVGDGECQEGQIWEAIMVAAQYRLDNLILFVDHNGQQIDGPVAGVNAMESFCDKFRAFRWNVSQVDGHDFAALHGAILAAKEARGAPTAVVMNTVKGQGCSFALGMHNHHIVVEQEQAREAIAELSANL